MYNTDLPTRAELPSTGKLLRSTAIAALIAAVLLVTTVLPAEYGIDPSGVGRALGLTQMGGIKVTLAAEANAEEAQPAGAVPPPSAAVQAPAIAAAPDVGSRPEPAAQANAATQQHTMSITLKPGQAAEIKLAMRKDTRVRYEWATQGGSVNYDTHGDPVGAAKSFYHGYGKGLNATGDAGMLLAAFDGKHGWFWRNRSDAQVTVTLKTSGGYDKIKRVF